MCRLAATVEVVVGWAPAVVQDGGVPKAKKARSHQTAEWWGAH